MIVYRKKISYQRARQSGTVRRERACNRFTLLQLNRLKSRNRCAACVGYVQYGYSFMPAKAALRFQSNKADRSSWAHDDGVVGTDL
jgi:hypothetical protein